MATEQDKGFELSEQTPLKSDTDAPAVIVTGTETTTTEGGPTVTTTVISEKQKRWFFNKKNKANKTEEGSAVAPSTKDVESGTVATTNETKKKNQWWQRKPCPTTTHNAEEQQGLSYGVNLVQRDDHALQTGIDMGYDQIYGEPDSVHSLDCVWRNNFAIFQAVRSFFYKLFSLIIAIPLAIVFGILFALFSALSVFVFVPAGVLLSIPVGWVFKLWGYAVRSIFDPIFHAVGHTFANVKVSRYGYNTDPTATLNA